MKSHGILSRYVRPGYSRGQYVQEAKKDDIGGGIRDYDKKRREFFRNPNIVILSRTRLSEDDPYDSEYAQISYEDFDPAKVRDGTQIIVELDPETEEPILDKSGFSGSFGFEDAPFLFYDSPDDVRRQLDTTDKYLRDRFGISPSSLYGKPFKDDISFLDKITERVKTGLRGGFGFVKNLPEMAMGAYRFINPIDALGGIGPYDTFFPKSEAQQKQVDNMYNVPGYTGEDGFTGVGALQTPSTFLDANPEMYKDTLIDDELNIQYNQALTDAGYFKNLANKYGDMRDKEAVEDMMSFGMSRPESESLLSAIRAIDIPELDESMKALRYFTDRDAIQQDAPGATASVAATIPVALGPVTALGQGANLLVKGNRLSQLIRKIPTKGRFVEGSIGLGLPQAATEYTVRENPLATYFASDDL